MLFSNHCNSFWEIILKTWCFSSSIPTDNHRCYENEQVSFKDYLSFEDDCHPIIRCTHYGIWLWRQLDLVCSQFLLLFLKQANHLLVEIVQNINTTYVTNPMWQASGCCQATEYRPSKEIEFRIWLHSSTFTWSTFLDESDVSTVDLIATLAYS